MSRLHGTFVWYELMTRDGKAAEAFYREVLPWHPQDAGLLDPYTLLCVGERPIGGLMEPPRAAFEAGVRPGWRGHIAVDDVDGLAARVVECGGLLHHAPEEIPGVGRFATVSDPQGATFVIFRASGDAEGREAAPQTPGHVGWHELHAGDGERAFDFYHRLFGWAKAEAMDMGPSGIYQLFATGKEPVGAVRTKGEAMPFPCWLYYFNVDDIETGAAGVKQGGGNVLSGPHQVPGGRFIVQGLDPQGVMFALLGPKR